MQSPWFLGGKRNKPGQSSTLNMPLFLRQNIFNIFLQICPFSNISPLFSVSISSTHGMQGKTESCYVSMLNISILYSIVFPSWNIHGLLENAFFFLALDSCSRWLNTRKCPSYHIYFSFSIFFPCEVSSIYISFQCSICIVVTIVTII